MEAVFLSDLHLTSVEERNGQTLLRFLTSLRSLEKQPVIFLLGDIFDLWVSNHRVFVRRYLPLLEAFRELVDRGARIVYFEGNHDMHLARYWEKELKADVRVAPGLFQLGDLRIRCEHGDEINKEDTSYLRLRAFLRHPVLEAIGHTVPGGFWDALGRRWSKSSRHRARPGSKSEREERIRAMIRSHAERVWEDDPFDAIITGHMHVRDDWEFEKGGFKVREINLGSWFEEPEVLVLENGRLEWRKP